jgi:hypothetical protein
MTRLAPSLSERNETALERCDRHLAELMQEVRVAQTGVQVLFGFLLTVPFTARFGAATRNTSCAWPTATRSRALPVSRWR